MKNKIFVIVLFSVFLTGITSVFAQVPMGMPPGDGTTFNESSRGMPDGDSRLFMNPMMNIIIAILVAIISFVAGIFIHRAIYNRHHKKHEK